MIHESYRYSRVVGGFRGGWEVESGGYKIILTIGMEHMILAIKSKLSLEVSEEETETPALPISILFVLKKMD